LSENTTYNLELKRFAIDNIIVFIRIFSMSVFAVFSSILLAHALGTTNKGIYELVILLTTIVAGTIFNLGIPGANIYFTANRQYDLKSIVNTNIAMLVLLIPMALLVAFGMVKIAGDILFTGVPEQLLYLGMLVIPFFLCDQTLSYIFSGLQDFRSLGLVDATQPFITSIILLCLYILNKLTVTNAIFALVIGYILTNALILWLFNTKLSGWNNLRPNLNVHFAKDLLIYGFKVYGSIVISMLLLRIDLLMLTSLGGGPASVGIYAIAITFGERIWTLSGFASTVLLPRIASWQDEENRRNQLTLIVGKYTLWISLIGALMLLLFGQWVINLLFPIQFSTSYTALIVLLPGIIMYNLGRVFGADVIGRGKANSIMPIVLVATVLNILLNLILIPQYDFVGAAVASSIAYSLYGLVLMWRFLHSAQLPWSDMVLPNADDKRHMGHLWNMVKGYTWKLISNSMKR
jgi:O-antigen/teichoic acid export membrane protein